jgi:hypothetical protein
MAKKYAEDGAVRAGVPICEPWTNCSKGLYRPTPASDRFAFRDKGARELGEKCDTPVLFDIGPDSAIYTPIH